MGNNLDKISAKLNGNEVLALDSMVQGESVVDTAHNLAVSVQEAQMLRKAVYCAAEEFVEFGSNTKEKQQKLIDFCKEDEQEEPSEIEENKLKELEKQLEPFKDEYFGGLSTKQIAALAKKANRLTEENSKLVEKLDNMKEALECAKHNVEVGQETLEQQAKNVEEMLALKDAKIKELEGEKEADFGNFLVFNPEKGSPNKVYKNINRAIEDAKSVAKKEQESVFVLRICSLIVPKCSFDIHDVSKSGIPSSFMNEEIPF